MIETCRLCKTFKTRWGVVNAVRGIDLQVEAGEIFGFLGPNGAGKTTTLRMLSTLLPPSGGQATVAGYDLVHQPARVRERIGYVSETGGVDPIATGREELMLQTRLYGLDKASAHARTTELITLLELEPFIDRPTRTYSNGQRRRLDLALGMIHRPMLLFFDEPTVGLDPQSRARLWDEIRNLRTSGVTVFLTTHYLDEADALCDRLAIIDGGQIVAKGTPDALKRQVAGDVIMVGLDGQADTIHYAHELLRVQPFVHELHASAKGLRLHVGRGEAALPDILRVLDGAGFTINTITLAHPTLDDVFFRLTGRSLSETTNAPTTNRQWGNSKWRTP